MSDDCNSDKWVKVGMEVPFVSNTCFKWVEASVPTPAPNTHTGHGTPAPPTMDYTDTGDTTPPAPPTMDYTDTGDRTPPAPSTTDYGSCFVTGTPPTYLTLRICKSRPHVLEIRELEFAREMPRVGLRILFPDALSPFAYICENQDSAYILYALSVSGIAYRLLLDHVSHYTASYVFSPNEVFRFDTKIACKGPPITATAATAGFLVVGRSDGSVSRLQLGECDEHAPDVVQEFEDKTTFFLGLISRKEYFGSVRDLVISEIHGNKVVFVLHSCGNLQVWDLHCQVKILSQYLHNPGHGMKQLRVGADIYSHKLSFALLSTYFGPYRNTEQIRIYSLDCPPGGKYSVSESSLSIILCDFVPEKKLIDLMLTSNKLYYVRTDRYLEWNFSEHSSTKEVPYYSLQEELIAKQLFQSSEHSSDSLYQAIYSISSSSKAQINEIMSSIFLQRLLHPGVYDISVFCCTFELYGKHWTENEFEALAVGELRREIQLLIEHEDNDGSPFSVFVCWKEFCSRYLDQWRKRNQPYCLFFDSSTQAVGVVRQSGLSLFRSSEDIELPQFGKFNVPQFGFVDCDILFEVLCYTKKLKQHVCPFISPIFYESVINARHELEDIVPFMIKTNCEYKPRAGLHSVEPGACVQSELIEHKGFKVFSVSTLLSLCSKSSGWGRILNAVQRYLKLLTPKNLTSKMDSEMPMIGNTSLIVQATSQVAETMFESTLDMLLFMVYLLDIRGQVHLLPDHVLQIRNLISMIHEVIVQWVIIRFLSTTPSESLLKEESTSNRISWTQKLGSGDFSLAFVVLLDAYDSPEDWNIHFPNRKGLVYLVRLFSSWILWARSMEMVPALCQIVYSLIRHGQYKAIKILFMIADLHLRKNSRSIQCGDDGCALRNLRRCFVLAQIPSRMPGSLNGTKVEEVMKCFFRDRLVPLMEDVTHHSGFRA